MLFQKLSCPDRKQTQLAYRVKYWPWCQLSPAARELVRWKKHTYIKKADIELACNETKETMFYAGQLFKIVWAHNNVPTEYEWNKTKHDRYLRAEFRRSPAITETAVVILSFDSFPAEQGEEL